MSFSTQSVPLASALSLTTEYSAKDYKNKEESILEIGITCSYRRKKMLQCHTYP